MLKDGQVFKVNIDRRLGEIIFRFEMDQVRFVRLVHKAELDATDSPAGLLTNLVDRIREQTEAAVRNVGMPTLEEVGS